MHLNKHISWSQELRKYLTYEAHFFPEHWKFHVDSKNKKKKNQQNFFIFLDNLISIGNGKFSQLIREYSELGSNVLSRSPEISDLIKNNFSYVSYGQNDEKVG